MKSLKNVETKSHILIVDDNETLCASIKDTLAEDGYAVDSAFNGKDAIGLCRKNSYDIALVDVKLPDISSNEVVNQISNISPSTEFIYMTAHSSLSSAIEAVKQGHVISYETKPLNLDHLLSIIKQITERKKAERQIKQLNETNDLRLESLLEVANTPQLSIEQMYDFVLDKGLLLTNSKVGFLGFMNEDESVFAVHSWSKEVMKTCTVMDSPLHFPVKDAGIWAESIRQRKPIIINDYALPNPHKKGLPKGHSELLRLITLPIFDRDKIIAVIAMANKENDYDESDTRQLSLLMLGLAGLIQRKKDEEQIKTSLKEKEVLLKEIHHRVKNNMNVIVSLLRIQSQSIKDKQLLDIFKDCENRVNSMSLIHEALYQTKDLAEIDLAEYIRNLANRVVNSYKVHTDKFSLNINVDNMSLGIDKAIPCGLIINELISNVFKYAFPFDTAQDMPEDKKGELKISMRRIADCGLHLPAGKAGNADSRQTDVGQVKSEISDPKSEIRIPNSKIELIVSDNGVGLPEEFDFKKTESLGLRLVNGLTLQLDGTVELNRNGGTEFKIVFEAIATKSR